MSDAKGKTDAEHALETECSELIHKTVSTRMHYYSHILKSDRVIVDATEKLLKMESTFRLKPADEICQIPDDIYKGLREYRRPVPETMRDLTREVEELQSIVRQIKNDKIHTAIKEEFNPQRIISKIETMDQ